MPSGGLLRDPSLLFKGDSHFQRTSLIQLSVCAVLLLLSAFYHYILRKEAIKQLGARDDDVAEVAAIYVYPIKSAHGVSLKEAAVFRKGLKYDRRWLIVDKKSGKWLSLREDANLTLIIPSFDTEDGRRVMRLRWSENSDKRLPTIEVPLEPSDELLSSWEQLPPMDFYGSSAQGRVVQMAEDYKGQWTKSPSEWISQALGYPVYLLQFDDDASKRQKFTLYKPPHDLSKWEGKRRQELEQHTDIEFQDVFPFLISTEESLANVNMQLEEALQSENPVTKVNKEHWTAKRAKEEAGVRMQSFRPNIVLRSQANKAAYPAFSEDSWDTIWITTNDGTLPIHFVSRCKRCLLTAVDPETAFKDINVPLGLLRKSRYRVMVPKGVESPFGGKGPCFGMYGVPEKIGSGYPKITVGDAVRVRWRPLSADDEVEDGFRKV